MLRIFVLFLIYHGSESCGITTHTEIAHRAASHFDYLLDNSTSIKDLINKYQSAFQAGNPYPDSFYPNICKKGVYHSISEDTHWVPFLNATINYIRKTYTRPYNEDALRLIVFTLGYTSHQIADVTWHSLGVNQGFLSAMGYVNFHGSFDQAHSVGDTGGDIVNQFELNTSYIADLGDWYVPYKDLYNIYLEFYGNEEISELDIIECSSLLFAGRLGEQLAISLLYTQYSRKSPFLINKLNDYFLGGIDDMATWTQLSWNKVLYMIENGVEKCQLDHNIININCNFDKNNKKLSKTNKKLKTKEPKFYNQLPIDENLIEKKILNKGLVLSASPLWKKVLQKNSEIIEYGEKSYGNIATVQSNSTYYVLNDYASLGWSFAVGDINSDGSDDLIMGAPVYSQSSSYQNGKVFIKLSKNGSPLPLENINLENDADIIINPPMMKNYSRFGHAVKLMDLNQDGYTDIIISAPSYNLDSIKYEGQVYVYFGGKGQDFNTPSIVITCKNYLYCNLGLTLEKGDVDGDLIDDLVIGSPYASTKGDQSGFIGVLLSKEKSYPSNIDVSTGLDWIVEGNMIYEWFGFSLKIKYGLVAVGAPQSRICFLSDCTISDKDIQAAGRVYLYKYPSKTIFAQLQGEENFEQFGYDFDMSVQLNNRKVIAISSYTKDCQLNSTGAALKIDQGGIVQVFDITNLNNISILTTLKSDRPYAGFGSKIKFFDVNNDNEEDLFISAQIRSDSYIAVGNVQEGIVFMFKGGSNFPTGNFTDECFVTDLTPCPLSKADIVFENKQNRNRFGHDIEILRSSSNKTQIVISAPRSDNNNSRLSGQILLFSLNSNY